MNSSKETTWTSRITLFSVRTPQTRARWQREAETHARRSHLLQTRVVLRRSWRGSSRKTRRKSSSGSCSHETPKERSQRRKRGQKNQSLTRHFVPDFSVVLNATYFWRKFKVVFRESVYKTTNNGMQAIQVANTVTKTAYWLQRLVAC